MIPSSQKCNLAPSLYTFKGVKPKGYTVYNQLSGKIIRIALRQHKKFYFAKHKGLKHRVGEGDCFWNMLAYSRFKSWLHVQIINLNHLYVPVKNMSDYPTISTQERGNFYSAYRYKLRTSKPYIMENSEIPFEFFHQPALPCFVHLVPTRNDNLTFQQTLKGI